MLRIAESFVVENPKSVDEALVLLETHGSGARLMAGGTDLLPNIKHGLHAPEVIVNLKSLEGLREIELSGETYRLGALCSIHQLATDSRVQAALPGLAAAARVLAGPQLRRMGTLGGNVLLDTRCVYINQTHFWRQALGFCLKKDGTQCHVVTSGKKCVAAISNDTAPPLICLGARAELVSPRGTREVAVESLYINDGAHNNVLEPDEILTAILIPRPPGNRYFAFEKLRIRDAIDFPILNVALAYDLDEAGVLSAPEVVVGTIAARPRKVRGLPTGPLDATLIERAAKIAERRIKPLTNINADLEWRRKMVGVLVTRAFASAITAKETV